MLLVNVCHIFSGHREKFPLNIPKASRYIVGPDCPGQSFFYPYTPELFHMNTRAIVWSTQSLIPKPST